MVLAGLVGALLALVALRQAEHRVAVAVAAHDLHAGSVIGPGDVKPARVGADGAVLDTLVPPRRLRRHPVVGTPVGEGELLTRRALRPRAAPDGQRAMSIPIDPSRAVNGHLAAGDRIDVLLATDAEIVIVLADAPVLDVAAPESGGLGGSRQFAVTVAVDARQSQLLAAAIADGDVLIARTTGARSSKDVPPLPVGFADRAGGIEP
jgi:Flp pilus assembly protein CpaB